MIDLPASGELDGNSDDQRRAFTYLRDHARSAHREGDGMLVQHLSAVALRSLVNLALKSKLELPLKETYWAAVFSLNWMVQDYSVFILRHEVFPKVIARESEDSEIRRLINAVLWLVERPLHPVDQQLVDGLRNLRFEWISGREEVEAATLLTFICELLWYRDPVGESWARLLDEWVEMVPSYFQTTIKQTIERLVAQRTIAFPENAHHEVKQLSELFPPEIQMLHRLWLGILRCDFSEVDNLRSTLLPKLPSESWTESQISRILFDFHHATRGATSSFGDPQELGLTRRQLLSANNKAYAVAEARDAHFSEEFAELLRIGPSAHKPGNRLQCFRLAMLKELFSLREWDYSDWREALQFQSACYLEAVRADHSLTAFIAPGIRLAVASRNFRGMEDPLTATGLATLDRAPMEIREQLVRELLLSHPLEHYDALSALSEISDAIPERILSDVADWSVRFVMDVSEKLEKTRGSRTAPLGFWRVILENVESTPELCRRLFPALLKEADGVMPWLGKGRGIFETFLRRATQEHAVEVLNRLARTRCNEEEIDFEHWALIFNALLGRPELREERFVEFLRSHANRPLRAHYLRRLNENASTGAFAEDEALMAWLRQMLETLGPASGSTIPFSSSWFRLVHWTARETDLIDLIIAGVNNPQCSCTLISALLNSLAAIVPEADQTVVSHLEPVVEQWLRQSPKGQNHNQLSPVSVVRIVEPDQNDIEDSLGRLANVMLNVKGHQWFQAVLPWIERFSVAPPPAPLPLVSALAFRLGCFSDEPNSFEFLSLGESLVEYAFGQAENDADWMITFGSSLSWLHQILVDAGDGVKAGMIELKLTQLLKFISRLLPRAATLSNPDVRAAAAKLTHWWIKNGYQTESLTIAVELFRQDPRARVRHQMDS